MLTQLLSVQKAKPELTDVSISFLMTTNVMAGSDTTTGGLRAVFYLLLKHPDKLQRLLQELHERKESSRLGEIVSSEQARSCHYLQAVLYESLRLLPPVGAMAERNVPEGGMTIGPYYIPAGVSSFDSSGPGSAADRY